MTAGKFTTVAYTLRVVTKTLAEGGINPAAEKELREIATKLEALVQKLKSRDLFPERLGAREADSRLVRIEAPGQWRRRRTAAAVPGAVPEFPLEALRRVVSFLRKAPKPPGLAAEMHATASDIGRFVGRERARTAQLAAGGAKGHLVVDRPPARPTYPPRMQILPAAHGNQEFIERRLRTLAEVFPTLNMNTASMRRVAFAETGPGPSPWKCYTGPFYRIPFHHIGRGGDVIWGIDVNEKGEITLVQTVFGARPQDGVLAEADLLRGMPHVLHQRWPGTQFMCLTNPHLDINRYAMRHGCGWPTTGKAVEANRSVMLAAINDQLERQQQWDLGPARVAELEQYRSVLTEKLADAEGAERVNADGTPIYAHSPRKWPEFTGIGANVSKYGVLHLRVRGGHIPPVTDIFGM